jgi:hypothetical protein
MQIFADLPAIEQKHNHAVALYSLGLISQLLGLEREALEHYEKSLAAFEVAKRHWSTLPGTDPCVAICQACCADIPLRIEKLMEYVMRARRFEGTTAIRCSLLLGCWPLDPTLVSADQLIVEATVSALTVDMELRHAGNTYKLERPGGAGAPEPVIQPSQEYYVVKIPEDLAQAVWRQDAEYALVCRDMRDSYFGIGTETNKNTPLWGIFIADAEGNMQLRATYEHDFLPWPRLVGESNLDRKMSGSIVGVFRRVNA